MVGVGCWTVEVQDGGHCCKSDGCVVFVCFCWVGNEAKSLPYFAFCVFEDLFFLLFEACFFLVDFPLDLPLDLLLAPPVLPCSFCSVVLPLLPFCFVDLFGKAPFGSLFKFFASVIAFALALLWILAVAT